MSQFRFARTSRKVLCLTGALVLGTGAAMVYASTTSATGEISACFNNNNGGQLRVLAAGAACDTQKETPISWNIEGVRGPQGIPGEKGDPGEAGPAGPQGIRGPAALTNVEMRISTGTTSVVTSSCDFGEVAIGGGYRTSGPNNHVTVNGPGLTFGLPGQLPTLWTVRQTESGNSLTVYAFCTK